jgi:outer membrane protein TolC
MKMEKIHTVFFTLICVVLMLCASPFQVLPEESSEPVIDSTSLDLDKCVEIALENNHQLKVSKYAVDIAEAQHKQATSAFWPELMLQSRFTQLDEDPNFVIPGQSYSYNVTVPPLAPMMPPITANGSVDVPGMDVKLMDKRTLTTSLALVWPLYTGGKIRSIAKQAEAGIDAAREEARRSDLQVVYDVKRMYYGDVLATKLHGIGKETLERMEVTLDLTEELYKKSSGTVKKTDYLRNKVMVESIRSVVALLDRNRLLARAALINTMGLNWDNEIVLSEIAIPYDPFDVDMRSLVVNAYTFNPDWAKIDAGLRAREEQVREAKSDYFPKIGFEGRLTRIDNNYDYGLITDENKNSWSVGLGMELPLFRGFRTKNKVREARVRLEQIKEQKILLREGIALQIKDIFYRMVMAQEQQKASGSAVNAAVENRDLNIRAYRDELVETQDVIEAQLLEFFIKTQFEKALYDHIESQANLHFVVGTEIEQLFNMQ